MSIHNQYDAIELRRAASYVHNQLGLWYAPVASVGDIDPERTATLELRTQHPHLLVAIIPSSPSRSEEYYVKDPRQLLRWVRERASTIEATPMLARVSIGRSGMPEGIEWRAL